MYRIPSIQHYCHRWCARCSFQSLCGFYQAQHHSAEIDPQEWSDNIPEPPEENPLKELDLAQIEALPQRLEAKKARGDFDPERSHLIPLFDQWKAYYSEALALINNKWEQAEAQQEAYLKEAHFIQLWDARETLIHYRNFVGPKLHRALGGLFDASGIIPPQSDWNGSAKAILLCLDVLQESFERLERLLPEEKAMGAWILCNLDFRAQIKSTFPDAEAFIRPGFDQIKPSL